MESSPRDYVTKRSLVLTEVLSDEETVEKRRRLEAEDENNEKLGKEMISDERVQEDSPTEVIYELSPDNEQSLSSFQDVKSPNKSEENDNESDKNEETKNKQESEGEESDKNEEKREGDSDESSKIDDSDDESDHNKNEESYTSGDSRDSERDDDQTRKSIVENLSEDGSDEDEVEKKPDSKRFVGRSPIFMSEESSSEVKLPSTVEIDFNDEEEEDLTDNSKDEDDERMSKKEERKEDEKVDGGGLFGKSDDYSKKSVEDLEGLQEDIHKELAQITGKSLQRRKHKKASSTSHREKRHKEKSSSRHKEKEKSSETREISRKDYEKRRTKYREYDAEDKWSHDMRWTDSKKVDRRDRGEKPSWSQTYSERSPNQVSTKSTRREGMETMVVKVEQTMYGTEPSGSIKESSKDSQKGVISYSMREMIRASMKERKPERPKDLRGFSREIIDSESDDSGEHVVEAKMSDVSTASSEEMDAESSPELPELPPYLPAIEGCRSVEEFRWLNRIEEGTYGVVYRAEDKRTGEIVALKKLKMEKEKEGFPITSLREINTLLKAQHPNIVTVQEIVVGNNMDKIYIVMDFVEHDLKALMETMTQAFLGGEIKTIMIQLLRAVNHLHDNWILHRDIKTSNLLLSNKGILKVGDFGLAREYGSPLKPYTPIVVTLWYRAPELLLGAKEYSTPIDLWSVGCVFAELLTMKPLFNGQSEIGQINKIFKELGTPSDKIWPGPPAYSEFPATKKMTFAEYPYNNLRNRFGATLTDNGFDLLNSFLTYDPNKRITAEDALKHEYFKESPSPVDPSMFPSWPARSEGAKRTKKASPKAPEGGNFYKSLSGDGDTAGFHIPAGKSKGVSAVAGFTLKF